MNATVLRNLAFGCLLVTLLFAFRAPVQAAGCEWTDSYEWESEGLWYHGCESNAVGTLGAVGRCETGTDSCLDALEFCLDTCDELYPWLVAFFSCEPEEPEQESADFVCRCDYCTEIDRF